MKSKRFKSKAMFTFVGGVLIINPAFAQDTPAQRRIGAKPPAQETQQQATGRGDDARYGRRHRHPQQPRSGDEIKRDAAGVVDAISAEDIGKFPDTNLAESLQRITGISIERRDGEGAQVTARGFGPQFNMVTLNGRQMPGADAFGAAGQVAIGGVGRRYPRVQLRPARFRSDQRHRGLQDRPGAGAQRRHRRHHQHPDRQARSTTSGIVASAGVKAVSDESQPFDNDITPEVSGIFSFTNADKTLGIGVSASYQKRKGGSVQATENDWNVAAAGPGPMPGTPTVVENAPADRRALRMPNDLRYAFSEFERERINGQAVVQFAPTDSLTLTLDYTYSTNEITENRGEQTMWLQNSHTPHRVRYQRRGGHADLHPRNRRHQGLRPRAAAHDAEIQARARWASMREWDVSDDFRLSFDAHNSKNESRPERPDDRRRLDLLRASPAPTTAPPARTAAGLGAGAVVQQRPADRARRPGTRPPRTRWPVPTAWSTRTSSRAKSARRCCASIAQTQDSEIKQGRIDGEWNFDSGRFQFGVDSLEVFDPPAAGRGELSRPWATGAWPTSDGDVANGLMDLMQADRHRRPVQRLQRRQQQWRVARRCWRSWRNGPPTTTVPASA